MTGPPRRTKRTCNLAEPTVRRVRELPETFGAAPTRDGVVDLAVKRLYLELRERAETERWASAAEDAEFKREMRAVEADMPSVESWPE